MRKLSFIILAIVFLLSPFYSRAQLEFSNENKFCSSIPIIGESQTGFKGSVNPDYIIDSVSQLMETGHFAGVSLCVVHNGEEMWKQQLGWANIENNIPVSDSAIFLLASISKTMTATAIMNLWEDGFFNLEDDINDYMGFDVRNPNYPNEPITFYQLLTHTSSINDYALSSQFTVYGSDSPIQLDTFLYHYLVPGGNYYNSVMNYNNFMPGAEWDYSNVGYALIGYLVECISGLSLEGYCQQYIFEPLEMNNTSWFQVNLDTNKIALQYEWTGTGFAPYGLTGYPYYPACQLRCSTIDLAKFINMTSNGGSYNGISILDSATVELMTTKQILNVHPEFGGMSYGLGWAYSHGYDFWYHTGGYHGALAMSGFIKNDDNGFVFLSNGDFFTSSIDNFYSICNLMLNYTKQYKPFSIDSICLSDADGDHILEPGEEVELFLGLKNNINISDVAEGVTLQLSTSDPSIAGISDDAISFGDINYNEMVFENDDFLKFTLNNNLPFPETEFELTINWNGSTDYVTEFTLQIGAADVLLVKDESDWRASLLKTERWYLNALDSLGYSTYYYDRSIFGEPGNDFLSHFPVIIWYTGFDAHSTLSENDQQTLSGYLDNGGNLFLSGQNISDELADSYFLEEYLHVSHVEDSWSGLDIILGIQGDPIGNGLAMQINQEDGITGHNSMSVVEAIGEGEKVFGYSPTLDGAAVRYENSTFKSVFFGFGFETIKGIANRNEVLLRILEYFDLNPGVDEPGYLTQIQCDIHVYPNPANRILNITAERFTVDEVTIYTLAGQKIYAIRPDIETIDISHLQPGMYIVEVTIENKKIRQKLLVQR